MNTMPFPQLVSPEFIVGVDIGGTKIASLVTDSQFRVYGESKVQTNVTTPQATVDSIVHGIGQALQRAGVSLSEVAGIGIGIPGKVNPALGLVELAVNLNWQQQALGAILANVLGVACYLENDTRLAAIGAHHLLGVPTMAYVSLGTGIAAGFILNGQLYRGAHGMAGEIGHIVIDPAGPRCKCGNLGCLEALVSGPAIAEQGRLAVSSGRSQHLGEPITAESVSQAAQAGDKAAQAIIATIGRHLGQALQLIVMAYDIEQIILGGGVAQLGDSLRQAILCEWQRQAALSSLAATLLKPEMIGFLPAGYNAGAWGGLILASQAQTAHQPTRLQA